MSRCVVAEQCGFTKANLPELETVLGCMAHDTENCVPNEALGIYPKAIDDDCSLRLYSTDEAISQVIRSALFDLLEAIP